MRSLRRHSGFLRTFAERLRRGTTAQGLFVASALAVATLSATSLATRTMLRPELLADDGFVTGSIDAAPSLFVPAILALATVASAGLAAWVVRQGPSRATTGSAIGGAAATLAALVAAGTWPLWTVAAAGGFALGVAVARIVGRNVPSAEPLDPNSVLLDPTGVVRSAGAGIGPGFAEGSALFDQVHVQDRVAFRCALDQALQGENGSCRVRLAGADGIRTYAMTARAVAETGTVAAAFLDVSADAARIERLELAGAEAEASSRAKSRFIAVAAHELRTPLNAILGFTDLLQARDRAEQPLPWAKRHEYAGLVHDAGEHLLGLVNDLLSMSAIEAGRHELQVEPIDAAPLVAGCLLMLEPLAAARGVGISNLADRALPPVEADGRALRQIVVNLVSNALKHAPAGSNVNVTATRRGDTFVLGVSDAGPGMSAEDLERLGEPFTRLGHEGGRERAVEGTGLGFCIVQGLVELHDGEIAVRSVEAPKAGHGTDVTVSLPLRHRARARVPRVVRLADHGRDASEPHHRSNEYGRVSA